MILYLRLAWRNIWRHKRRTLIVVLSIGLTLAMMMLYDGLITGFQDAMGLAPALGQDALVEAVRVLGLAGLVGDRLQGLGGELGAELPWVFVLEVKAQPDVEEIRQLGVVEQAAEWGIGDDEILRLKRRQLAEVR